MKNKKGISLIVLVITIIVMIILAAAVIISINNTGIIDRANHAVNLTDKKQVQDLAALIWADAYMEKLNNPAINIESYVKNELANNGVTTDKYDIIVSDSGVVIKDKNSSVATIAPGLYESGSNYSKMITSWDDLIANNIIFINDGVIITEPHISSGSNTSADALTGDLVISDTVTTIDEYGFYDCDKLTSVLIPNSVTTIKASAFWGCTELANITMSNGVTSIGSSAFSYCMSLAEITFPNSITTIPDALLSSCSSLTKVTIPNTITSIGAGAFGWSSTLTDLYYLGTTAEWNALLPNISPDCDLTGVTIHCTNGDIT